MSASRTSYAQCNPCTLCPSYDCPLAAQFIESMHAVGEVLIMEHTSNEFTLHRQWLTNTFFLQNVLPALMLFTEQMSAVAMQQVMIIGSFLDAKQQLETQRLFQELQNQAHKDYQPSEDFCWFGTGVRSMAHSEQRGRHTAVGLAQRQLARHLGSVNVGGAENRDVDKVNRWRQFMQLFCDPHDNDWESGVPGTGLSLACPSTIAPEYTNIDIDYTRRIDEPRTLNFMDFDVPTFAPGKTSVMALGNNLYGHDVLTRKMNEEFLKNKENQHYYLALRSIAAKRSVAENSFNAIVGLKSAGSSSLPGNDVNEFLGAILAELGVPDGEVVDIIGFQPSYYAQLELLAKKIYQNPDFYANLYDKPANVARKSVALKAIELMLDRAIYESQIRQEMAMSVLLSSRLRPQFRAINRNLRGGEE